MAGTAGREIIQKVMAHVLEHGGFDRCLRNMKILSAANGNLSATLKIEREHTNRGSMLHGGMATTIVDVVSGYAMMTLPNVQSSGVSVQLNMSFLKAVSEGDEVLIKATADRVGKRLAFLSVDIINKANGQVCVKGSHTKFVGGS